MTKKRHNIDTIAEILIDKIDEMQSVAKQIENSTKKPLKIDTNELEILNEELQKNFEKQTNEQKAFLSDLKTLLQNKHARLPNWVFLLLGVFFLTSTGLIFYSWTKIENYQYEKHRADYFENEYLKLTKKEVN
mgnify:FL=1